MLQIVIPAYNEANRLPRTLRELRRFVREHRAVLGPVEVVVVDNASTDATAEVAASATSAVMPVSVVGCPVRGKGAAVRAGVARTSADVVAFMDADGATHLDALLDACGHMALGADVAIGSRAALGADAEVRHSRLRETGAHVYRSLTARVVSDVADTQCGFKVMRGDLARAVFADLRTTGFSFDVELLARLQRRGSRIAEMPVQWVDVPGSTFAPLRHGAGSFLNLARIAWVLRSVPAPAAALPGLADAATLQGTLPVALPGAVPVAAEA